MLDWQVQEEDDSPLISPEKPSSRQLYRWRLVGGLLLLLLVAALPVGGEQTSVTSAPLMISLE